jgi:hypothetical protein
VEQPDLELAGLSVREERAVVAVRVEAHTEDLAVLAQRELTVEVHVAREAGRDEVTRLVLDPFDRPPEQDGAQDRAHISRVDGDLVAEPPPMSGAMMRIMCSGSSATRRPPRG